MPVATKEEIVEAISSLSVLELSELVKDLEEKFGVSAAMPMMGPMPGGGGGAEIPAKEEQTEFDVILASVGNQKIPVVKEIRTITSLGLKEAKALADEAPKPIKEKISKEEAEEIKAKLEAVGATVEIK